MGSYLPLDLGAYMETPDNLTCLRDVYSSEHVCKENAFSASVLTSLVQQLIDASKLVPVTVVTGGGRLGARFPLVNTWRGNPLIATIQANNQIKLSESIGGQTAFNEVVTYCQQHSLTVPTTPNATNLSLSNLMWRWTHRNADGSYPLVPVVVEISHHAEGYSAANSVEWGAAKVELSQLESHDVNESRKVCTRFGLMWRKPNGNLIGVDDDYAGPTMCFHGIWGVPCYAPHPDQWIAPTGATPNPRKMGGGKKRKDGSGGGRRKKKGSLDKGQRRLSFGGGIVTN